MLLLQRVNLGMQRDELLHARLSALPWLPNQCKDGSVYMEECTGGEQHFVGRLVRDGTRILFFVEAST